LRAAGSRETGEANEGGEGGAGLKQVSRQAAAALIVSQNTTSGNSTGSSHFLLQAQPLMGF
jgi:hypothetical protein